MSAFTFSEVQENQLIQLQNLAEKTFRATYQHLNDPITFEIYINEKLSMAAIVEQWQQKDSRFYLAWQEQEVVGYYKINLQKGIDKLSGVNSVELERIYLDQALQGNGYGAQLIKDAQLKAKAASFEWIWLGVWSENPRAIRFYEKHGFRIFSEYTFMMGPEAQRDFLMCKKL